MTLRTSLLPAIDKIRSILGPTNFAGGQGLDLRPTSIAVIQRSWSGGFKGRGRATDTVATQLPSYTKVRHVTQREIASSGARYEQGDMVIGPITPQCTDTDGTVRGFTEAQVVPRGAQGVEIIYRLALQSGATGIVADAYFVEFRRDRVFRYEIVVGRLRTTTGP